MTAAVILVGLICLAVIVDDFVRCWSPRHDAQGRPIPAPAAPDASRGQRARSIHRPARHAR